ncbi:MAG: hypothetical protein JRI68_28650, partial [Deltaproteobacteria bacterium]|nr:hypothetical protein [Deltaproteobacteria bacterium]
MSERGPTVAGLCAAVMLVTSLSGCAYRWVLSEPTEAASAAPSEPADQDAQLKGLVTARHQLEERLARVEQQLAALRFSKKASSE